jgi:chloramphenicol O-acetyltransferase type A
MSTAASDQPVLDINRPAMVEMIDVYSPLFLDRGRFSSTLQQYYHNPTILRRKLLALPLASTSTPPLSPVQIKDIIYETYDLDSLTEVSLAQLDTPLTTLRTTAMALAVTIPDSNTPPPTSVDNGILTIPNPAPKILPIHQHKAITNLDPDGKGGNTGFAIDWTRWDRRGNHAFFSQHLLKWCSLCSRIEAGEAKAHAKSLSHSFFIRTLYAAVRASNEIKNFRYRVMDDGTLVCWDKIGVVSPIKPANQDAFVTLYFPYYQDYTEFASNAAAAIANIDPNGDPYGAEKTLTAHGRNDVFTLSCMPNLIFTGMSHTLMKAPRENCTWPLVSMGQHHEQGGKNLIPVNVYYGHHFIDGVHLSQWMQLVSKYLQDPFASPSEEVVC